AARRASGHRARGQRPAPRTAAGFARGATRPGPPGNRRTSGRARARPRTNGVPAPPPSDRRRYGRQLIARIQGDAVPIVEARNYLVHGLLNVATAMIFRTISRAPPMCLPVSGWVAPGPCSDRL